MGCLIQLTYTKKASAKGYVPFFMKHSWFFANCIVQSVEQNAQNKYIVKIYVVHHHNAASKYMREVLDLELRLERTKIIS